MRVSFKNLILLMTIFMIQMNLLPDMAYSQLRGKKQSPRTNVVPVECVERLRAIYEGKDFSARSFEGTCTFTI